MAKNEVQKRSTYAFSIFQCTPQYERFCSSIVISKRNIACSIPLPTRSPLPDGLDYRLSSDNNIWDLIFLSDTQHSPHHWSLCSLKFHR